MTDQPVILILLSILPEMLSSPRAFPNMNISGIVPAGQPDRFCLQAPEGAGK
jgi:hypothetical protein